MKNELHGNEVHFWRVVGLSGIGNKIPWKARFASSTAAN